MAVGEALGGPARPRRVVSAGAARRLADQPADGSPGDGVEGGESNEPLIKEADPELERLLAEEEEIERLTREHHETPHFRPG